MSETATNRIHRLVKKTRGPLASKIRDKSPVALSNCRLDGSPGELLEILYFVYDKGISAIGDIMRGRLSRTQAAILWLIRSEGENARGMLRKDVARRLHNWFDLGSPAITTALQGLSQPPLRLVRLVSNANSGREKRVLLTPKGERFAEAMAARGQHVVQQLIADLGESLSDDEIAAGMKFLRLSVSFFRRTNPEARQSILPTGNTQNW